MPEAMLHEKFTAGDIRLEVTGRESDGRLLLELLIDAPVECLLHWGLSRRWDPTWYAPPASALPPGTQPYDEHAVRSACSTPGPLRIALGLPCDWDSLRFVLYLPGEDRWLKDGKGDFRIRLPRAHAGPTPEQALEAETGTGPWQRFLFDLDDGATLAAAVLSEVRTTRVLLACDLESPLLLHWGLAGRFRHQWQLPPADLQPAGSVPFDNLSLRTPFLARDGLARLELAFPAQADTPVPRAINCVLYQPGLDRWFKTGGRDIYLPLAPATENEGPLPDARLQDLAGQIVDAEMNHGSWTLMHRFNLCHDLLDKAQDDPEALALLYTWLRYSAIRQLDWQRNYNTQPRELAHAQERLTLRLADGYNRDAPSRPWLRLMLGTLGRGGDGQKVRDEILNIMHRHHVKEVHGHFLEEWHQKLHNNTTPDDVVICEAYLAFLHADGDQGRFYATLSAGGVSRERLQGFERPIRTDPEFYPDKKDGLAHDFEYFLRILKSVHSGTDLDTAAEAARGVLDDGLNGQLNNLYAQRHGGAPTGDQVATITGLRQGLAGRIAAQGEARAVREMLYLDLALEQVLRGAIEQAGETGLDSLTLLAQRVLDNLALEPEAAEFAICAGHLRALAKAPERDREWALQVKSVTDRAARAVAAWSETLYARLQPKAEYLGEAFEADDWTIPLFSEEVIRGGSGFLLSLLLRRLDPLLRELAGLGGWQVISPGRGSGQVEVVASLREVQGRDFPGPTVLVTDRVAGDEEIPEGVTSVLTSDTPDLVSHVAVRARNSRVLFATCYDDDRFLQLKAFGGRQLDLAVSPAGDVQYAESAGTAAVAAVQGAPLSLRKRAFSTWALAREAFNDEVVGGKSNNLGALRGRLSDSVAFPASMALPFGVFERTLTADQNRDAAERLEALLAEAARDPEAHLPRVRKLVGQLTPPPALREALLATWRAAGLPQTPWDTVWPAVTKVWASKWNERAWYSRSARGIEHDQLMMAVLIQQVVEADYAFVIHTVNPINGRDDELYAEVVPGLGETLVGNYPGRALGFVYRKSDLAIRILSYPGKSVGLYGSGVIFRSDSNGEDLERYAGAGLYDSFLATPPEERLLDYCHDPLVQDRKFRDDLLRSVARVGLEVERTLGAAQDIEGAIERGRYYVVQTRAQVGL